MRENGRNHSREETDNQKSELLANIPTLEENKKALLNRMMEAS
jgi:hypothetical protein